VKTKVNLYLTSGELDQAVMLPTSIPNFGGAIDCTEAASVV
jgi:hypothetical protein